MKYLYGDSSPFPLQFNFLATLGTFVASAAKTVQLQLEIKHSQDKTVHAGVSRERSLETLERFHRGIQSSLQGSAAGNTEPLIAEYSANLAAHATRVVDDMRRSMGSITEREESTTRSGTEQRRGEIRAALEKFLLAGRIPILESEVSMKLENGRNELSCVLTNPDGIVTGFGLSTKDAPAWNAPRKVSEFAHDLDFQIGTRKSWIMRTPQPDVVHIDDFVIGGFELSADQAVIALRRKPEMKDSLIFHIQRTTTGLVASVERGGDDSGDAAPTSIEPDERSKLESLWMLIRTGVNDVLPSKDRLISVTIDGEDALERDRPLPFVQRLVKMFAPAVAEISKRSPNVSELSLKSESAGGKREEIYLKKLDLAKHIEGLTPDGRAVFAPLGLLAKDDIPTLEPEFDD